MNITIKNVYSSIYSLFNTYNSLRDKIKLPISFLIWWYLNTTFGANETFIDYFHFQITVDANTD